MSATEQDAPDYIEECIQAIEAAEEDRTFGRPWALTRKVLRTLLADIEMGLPPHRATNAAGISLRTYQRWMEAAENDETESTPAYHFCRAVRIAEAVGQRRDVSRINTAGEDPRFWAAVMTKLQRRFPEEWADRSRQGALQNGPTVQVIIGIAPPGTPQNPLPVTVRAQSIDTLSPVVTRELVGKSTG